MGMGMGMGGGGLWVSITRHVHDPPTQETRMPYGRSTHLAKTDSTEPFHAADKLGLFPVGASQPLHMGSL